MEYGREKLAVQEATRPETQFGSYAVMFILEGCRYTGANFAETQGKGY